jgi:cystathionine beta-lyase/cystathionine gamma-synthase
VLELVPPRGVIVIPHNCYLGVAEAVDRCAARYGWQVRRVNVADTTEVLTAVEGADLVWIESPTNPTIEVADLPTLGGNLAEKSLFVVDNTFATPMLQRPLESGADIVLHSATKIISGHSDVLLGALVTKGPITSTLMRWTPSGALSELRLVPWRPISHFAAYARCRSGSPRRRPAHRFSPSGWPLTCGYSGYGFPDFLPIPVTT